MDDFIKTLIVTRHVLQWSPMARRWREVLESYGMETGTEKKVQKSPVPRIIRMTKETADKLRVFHRVGDICVKCDLACHGPNIPRTYKHIDRGIPVNVFNAGIVVKGFEQDSTYLGYKCDYRGGRGKICVTVDNTLRETVEKQNSN